MKKLLCILVTLALMLPVCASAQEVVNVFNWEDYIDESVLAQFEQETGIHVNYMRFTTNEDMIVQVEANPGAFDVCFPSDYIVERMLNKDMLAEIDYSKVPNAQYILDNLRSPDYDPDNVHSLPYMWGTVGILYNTTMVSEPVTSWNVLWEEQYKGKILMYDSVRDSIGITLCKLGYSLNTRDEAQVLAAQEALIAQKPLVRAYLTDDIKMEMINGSAALAVVYSGDALYCMDENPDLDYVVPSEGSNVWFDNVIIPKTSQHTAEAEAFINFLCDAEVARANAEYICYSSPNKAALALLGPEFTESPVFNPPQEDLDRCEIFHDLGDFVGVFSDAWTKVKAA